MNEVTSTSDIFVRHAAAGNGLAWWSNAFSWLFGDLSRLVVWIAMGLTVFIGTSLLHLVPGIGSIASFLLGFVLSGGLMTAAHKTALGQVVRFADLFSGFGPNAAALLGVGLLALLGMAVIGGLLLLLGMGAIFAAMASAWTNPDLASGQLLATGFGGTSLLLLVLSLCLLVPLSMALWLAPALIVLRGARPVDALRLSLAATWHSGAALTVYGIGFIFLSFAATIVLMVGWIFLMPLLFLSTYAAYRDLFDLPADVPDAKAA
jgi:hypothetical protein